MTELIKSRVVYGLKDVLSQFNPVTKGEATRSQFYTLITLVDISGGEWTTAGPVYTFSLDLEFHGGNKLQSRQIHQYLDAIREKLADNTHYNRSDVNYYHNLTFEGVDLEPENGDFVISISANTQDI